jgi:hypothetical protein
MPAQQQQINYGASANDGLGDPLRTAFIKTDDNFDAIWNAGPVGSNVTILNNIISVVNTNGNLAIAANGIGVIETRSSLIPRLANSYDLGSANLRYRSAYIGSGGLDVTGNLTLAGTFAITDLKVNTISSDDSSFVVVQDGLTVSGDLGTDAIYTDNYFYANGAPFSPGSSYGNANVAQYLASSFGAGGSNTIVTNGNIVAAAIDVPSIQHEFPIFITTSGAGSWEFAGNILRGPQGGSWSSEADTSYFNSPANGFLNLSSLQNGNVVSELFMEHSFIRFFIDNGIDATWEMQADGRTAFPDYVFPYLDGNAGEVLKTDGAGNLAWAADTTDYGNANVEALGESGWSGNIIPAANAVYSLGNATNYWSNLWVANNTIFIGGVPLGITGNTLTVNDEALLSNNSDTSITTTGNITAGNVSTGVITLTNGAQIRDTAGNAVAIGYFAGETSQGDNATAIGYAAGKTSQGNNATAVGVGAGELTQGASAVAIGVDAGYSSQGDNAVAIGLSAGEQNQGNRAVAIGVQAGTTSQGVGGVAIGEQAGHTSQGVLSVAIGYYAGSNAQSFSAVAIGAQAGETAQGSGAIAIGDLAGRTNQANNSIIINATGDNLDQITANTFTVAPVRNDVANVAQVMFYNTTSKEITYGNTISVAGNISGSNLITAGRVLASGNILGQNFATEGSVQASSVEAVGNITGANLSVTGNITGNTAGFAIGYRDIPQVSFTGNATMAASDAGKHFYSTESTDYVLTIADNSAVSWPVGTAITVVNRGTGNITVAQAAGVSLYLAGNATAGNRVVTTYGMATVLNVAANVWMINGTGVS